MVLPFIVSGLVKTKSGGVVSNTDLLVFNGRTGNSFPSQTNNLGQYVVDLNNFVDGFLDGDWITVMINPSYTVNDFVVSASANKGVDWEVVSNNFLVFNNVGEELVLNIEATKSSVLRYFSVSIGL